MKARFFSFFHSHIVIILASAVLSSCAGYHFNTNNNPLSGYDIRSVAVPMFVNRSVLPELAAPMTKEITLALNDYSGLKVYSGDYEDADAVLIGVIDSRDHYNEVVRTSEKLFTEDTLKSSVGSRSPFYYPVETSYEFYLTIYLIKRPTKEELQMLTTDLGQFMKVHPKVVLSDQINLAGSFNRSVGETVTSNGAGTVNFVKNRGIFEKSLQDTCASAAQTFKQVVLNAF